METIDEDAPAVLRAIGAPPHLVFPTSGMSETSEEIFNTYIDQLSVDLHSQLQHVYARDYELFDYEYRTFAQPTKPAIQ